MKLKWFVRDNLSLLITLFGTLITLVYFVFAHARVGVDPDQGAIVPQWDPPDKLSPAAVRYISRMGYDHKALTAALINAAVKGYIEIVQVKKK